MKILIIGSKGFIGSACYSYFKKKENCEVFAADVVVEYNDANYFQIDIFNQDYKEIFKNKSFDFCINCSGAASVPDSLQHPIRDYTLNVFNVAQLLNAIKEESPRCTFVQLSSAAVYGNPAKLPVSEHAELLPQSPYGFHKKHAEEICKLYNNFFGIKCFILRIFSAYGKGLKKQILWDLFQKTSSDKNILLHGTGKETRDFIYIDDILNAMDLIITQCPANFEIYNIANGVQVKIEELADKFINAIKFKGNINFTGDVRKGDPINWQADISKLKALGYTPKYSMDAGLHQYVQWLSEKR